MTVALVAGATAAQGKPSLAALRVQKSLTVAINKTTGYATATGYIKVNGKKVSVLAPSYVITSSDSSGNICGSAANGAGPKVKLQVPGSFEVAVTLRSKLKYAGTYLTITKAISADLGADQVRCAPMPSAPINPSQACDWGMAPANPDPSQSYCGVQIPGTPAWLTKPTLTMDASFVTVDSGEIASNGGCALRPLQGFPDSQLWLGGRVAMGVYYCGGGIELLPAVNVVYVYGGQQHSLKPPYQGTGAFAASFQFPARCAGELDTTFGFKVQQLPAGGAGVGKNEFSNAQLKLPGKDNCSQLVSNG